MPEIVHQAQLTEHERAVLKDALDGNQINDLINAIRSALKDAGAPGTHALKAAQLTTEQASNTRNGLNARLELVRALEPYVPAAAKPLVQTHEQALAVLDDVHQTLSAQ